MMESDQESWELSLGDKDLSLGEKDRERSLSSSLSTGCTQGQRNEPSASMSMSGMSMMEEESHSNMRGHFQRQGQRDSGYHCSDRDNFNENLRWYAHLCLSLSLSS